MGMPRIDERPLVDVLDDMAEAKRRREREDDARAIGRAIESALSNVVRDVKAVVEFAGTRDGGTVPGLPEWILKSVACLTHKPTGMACEFYEDDATRTCRCRYCDATLFSDHEAFFHPPQVILGRLRGFEVCAGKMRQKWQTVTAWSQEASKAGTIQG